MEASKNVIYEITIGPYKQIGSTAHFRHRMNCHRAALSKNVHWNSFMQNVWNKHQEFDAKIIMECETREQAYQEEQKLLDQHFGKPNFMMLSKSAFGAAKGRVSPMKGGKNTPETILKKSNAHNTKKIMQYDLNDNLIKIWDHPFEIKRTGIYHYPSIHSCCNGRHNRKTASGFKWKYEN